jgi:hypothetical protein
MNPGPAWNSHAGPHEEAVFPSTESRRPASAGSAADSWE